VWIYFYVPETKGIALEELAEIFGDAVAVRAADITIDHEKHRVTVDTHDQDEIAPAAPVEPPNKTDVYHMEKSTV
jgi:hypothetical protein